MLRIGVCALLMMWNAIAAAEVRLPALLSNNMVIQRDAEARLWGWADEPVTVTCGEWKRTVDPKDGRFETRLPKFPAGAVPDITVAEKNTITIKNVLAGDVWVCSGQSNMHRPLSASTGGADAAKAANFPRMRFFSVAGKVTPTPATDVKGEWVECTPETAADFSAVGFHFGRDLHKALDVPIGLIGSKVPGTPAEAWTPESALRANPMLAPLLNARTQYEKDYPKLVEKHKEQVAAQEADPNAKQRKIKPPHPPERNPKLPSVLYNGMIAPLTPMTIKGVIWYQGENNASHPASYPALLTTMIGAWRNAFGQKDLPFGIVQLANFNARPTMNWPAIREAQLQVSQRVPNVGLAVTIDIGDRSDVHPANKRDVGGRLARWALAEVYHRAVAWRGPEVDPAKIRFGDGAVRIAFTHADGLKTSDGAMPTSFEVAGVDKRFHPATATIEGTGVIVKSKDVVAPIAVRYGWSNAPVCNLQNADGLPASPFRTDDFPLETTAVSGDDDPE